MAADPPSHAAFNSGTPEDLIARLRAAEAEVGAHGGALAAVLRDARSILRSSEARYQSLLAASSALVCELTPEGVITFVNDAATAIIGYRPAELLGRRLAELSEAPLAVSFAGDVRNRELTLVAKGGAPVSLKANSVSRYAADGTLEGVVWVATEISDCKRIEADLQASEQAQWAMFELEGVGRAELTPDGRILRVNRKLSTMMGYARDALLQRNMADLAHADDRAECLALFARLAAGEVVDVAQRRYVRADGGTIWAQVNAALLPAIAARPARILVTVLDVTEHRRAREALATEKERLAVTLHSIADGVITTDEDGRVALINQVAQQLTGAAAEEAVGRPIAEVFRVVDETTGEPREDVVQPVLASGVPMALTDAATLVARDGARRLIAHSAAPIRDGEGRVIGAVLVFRDITERQRLEDELRKAQNLESLGVLAGGIAHDFNNILTVIFGNIALAKLRAESGEDVGDPLAQAEVAFGRARNLTQQLLTFSQGGAPIKTSGSIAALVRENAAFVLRGSAVRTDFALAPDLWPVTFDPGQMARVFDNIFINAMQAMPEGGALRIEARNVVLQKRRSLPLPPGRYVELRIKDSGKGIPREHMYRVFDPYFTTREEGSGLGLATVYSIVKRHGGYVTVNSKVGKGTTVIVHLPAGEEAAPVSPRPPGEDGRQGGGRILLMDDEEAIRQVGAALLQRLGYEVGLARDGEEALRLYRDAQRAARPFAAVVLDLTVPDGMGGKECIARLRELDAGVRAVVSSGYSTDPVMAQYRNYGFAGVVAKPYRLKDLGSVLAALIGRPASTDMP